MNANQLKKLMGNALTAASIREAGLNLVPIKPTGEIDETVLRAYIEAGMPNERFFKQLRLVTPEEMEDRRRAKPSASRFDPISGEAETPAVSAAWDALAPIQVVTGDAVSAADLTAYASSKGFISREVTSLLARMCLPKGNTPVSPPEILEQAALEWPYDHEAKTVAQQRRYSQPMATAYKAPTAVVEPRIIESSCRQASSVQAARVAPLLTKMFGADELRRFFVSIGVDRASLPGEMASLATLASEGMDTARRHGHVNSAFFDQLILARPGRALEIVALRNEFGL